MASFNKFNSFVEALAEKVHNLGSDSLKMMLSNSAPAAGNTVKADITEIAAGNGYTAGGIALVVASSSQTGGTYKLVVNDFSITAVGGAMATWRYGVIYNDTASNDELVGYYDFGSQVLSVGETFTFDADGTNGIIQIT